MNQNIQDKRIIKTKEAIHNALFSLLCEKNINDISITEVANRANINRKTFYAHYDSVIQVLDEIENESAHDLINILSQLKPEDGSLSPKFIFRCLDTILKNTSSYYNAIFSLDKNPMLINKYSKVLENTLYNEFKESYNAKHINEKLLPIISAFIAGGISNAYAEWIKNNPELDIDDVTELVSSLLVLGLNGLEQ